MDFDKSVDQEAIHEALAQLCEQHAGAKRAIETAGQPGGDEELAKALREGGFEGLALGAETGPIEATLAVIQLAAAAAGQPVGHRLLTLPCSTGELADGPVAVSEPGETGPIRFAVPSGALLVVGESEVRFVTLSAADLRPVPSSFGYPFARVLPGAFEGGQPLKPGSATRVRAWSRIALAAEMVGNMQAALDVTVAYLREREQFGRPIGSFQAVAHRLAECAVRIEGSRWLTLEAAARGGAPDAAALAAGHAARSAGLVHRETHQLSGAIGYTVEHDLHIWSMRLQALRLEMGGASRHFRDFATLRWRPSA